MIMSSPIPGNNFIRLWFETKYASFAHPADQNGETVSYTPTILCFGGQS